jgi:hypothetical protein
MIERRMNAMIWQRRRRTFNHDWLKNRYLQAIDSFQNVLDGYVEDPDFEVAFFEQHLPEWEEHRAEAHSLAFEFEFSMSPRVVVMDRSVLVCHDETCREWWGHLVHNLWIARYPIASWVQGAVANANAVEEWYPLVKLQPGMHADYRQLIQAASFREAFKVFRGACHALAHSIEQFPSTVGIA